MEQKNGWLRKMRRQVANALLKLGRSALVPAQHSSVITRGFASEENLKKTVLYDFHVAHGGSCPVAQTALDQC